MKAKYSDIKYIYDHPQAEEVKKLFEGKEVNMEEIAYFTPANSNWSYHMGITKLNGKIYMVVTVYGWVKAGYEIYLGGE